MQVFLDEHVDPVIESRAKKQPLPDPWGLVQNARYHGQKAHVSHVVCLVKHRNFDCRQVDDPLAHEVIESAGGRNHNVDAARKHVFLTLLRDATEDSGHAHTERVCDELNSLSDLRDEFTGRGKHDAARLSRCAFCFETVCEIHYERNGERNSLTRARTAAAENVSAPQRVGQRIALNGKRATLAVSSKRLAQRCGYAEVSKAELCG